MQLPKLIEPIDGNPDAVVVHQSEPIRVVKTSMRYCRYLGVTYKVRPTDHQCTLDYQTFETERGVKVHIKMKHAPGGKYSK